MMEEVATKGQRSLGNETKIKSQNLVRLVDIRTNTRTLFLFYLCSPLVLFRSLYFSSRSSLPLQPDLLRSYFTRDIYRTFLIRLLSSFQAGSRPTSNSVRKLLCEQTMRNERSNIS